MESNTAARLHAVEMLLMSLIEALPEQDRERTQEVFRSRSTHFAESALFSPVTDEMQTLIAQHLMRLSKEMDSKP